jgi:DNA-binding SARP family transcriptional activator
MSQALLRLLGAPAWLADDGDASPLAVERAHQLLVHLASRRDWTARDVVATLLWPDIDQASARRNLRKIVFRAARLKDVAPLRAT